MAHQLARRATGLMLACTLLALEACSGRVTIEQSAAASAGAGGQAGTTAVGGALDAGVPTPPTSFDAGCGIDTSRCSISPGDVVCSVDSDCTRLNLEACDCPIAVIGVNKKSTAICTPSLCPAGGLPIPCFDSLVQGQDCHAPAADRNFEIVCERGQCLSKWCGSNCPL